MTTSIVTPITCSKSQSKNIDLLDNTYNYNAWFNKASPSKEQLEKIINHQCSSLFKTKGFLQNTSCLTPKQQEEVKNKSHEILNNLYKSQTTVKQINQQINTKYANLTPAQKDKIEQLAKQSNVRRSLANESTNFMANYLDTNNDVSDPWTTINNIYNQFNVFADNDYNYFIAMIGFATANSIIALAQ